ncbi:hypothetical protein AYJ54_02690 [Bradyrhizobium centrolobii]|uniref:Uncharacterized protein n=1 Tax=Bradyrhizobium centrolobii TaxID=1505087 RepID=A0A176YGP2_9BRAD|nr:hypothetical protein AYJ54_02690 [Bradyrhizobium centrolobii]
MTIAIGNLGFDIAAALLTESLFRLLVKLFGDFDGYTLPASCARMAAQTGEKNCTISLAALEAARAEIFAMERAATVPWGGILTGNPGAAPLPTPPAFIFRRLALLLQLGTFR